MILIKRAGMKILSAFFILFSFTSCAGPRPVEEMVLARTALDAAKEAGAISLASGYWYRAEESFRKGKAALSDNYNYEAKEHFVESKVFAEKAENSARLKKFKSGEGYP